MSLPMFSKVEEANSNISFMIVTILKFIKAYVYLEIRSLIGKVIGRMECHLEVAVCYW